MTYMPIHAFKSNYCNVSGLIYIELIIMKTQELDLFQSKLQTKNIEVMNFCSN